MKLRNMMIIKSVICTVFAIAFLVVPAQALDLYGMQTDDVGLFGMRLLGSAFAVLAILLFMARSVRDRDMSRAIAAGVAVGDFIGFVVAIWGQLNGIANAFGWVTVAVYFLLAAGFAYFLLREPEASLRPAT